MSAGTVSPAGDPYFKVGAVTYAFETASGLCPTGTVLNTTCFVSGTPITAAISYIQTNGLIPTDKKIYVEQGTYTETVTIDGSSSVALSQLVGLIGVDGSALTTLNGSVSVMNTIGGFTLQGFNITGAATNGVVYFNNNTGALQISDVVAKNTKSNGNGIVVTNQTGAVTLTNVDSSSNRFDGATIAATGNVTINNSSFDRNEGTNSLQVNSTSGSITMTGVSSSRNDEGTGADLKASKGITLNYSHFEDNYNGIGNDGLGYGVYIEPGTAGTISMNTVFANGNEESNIYLYQVNSPVTMTTVEANNSEYGYGLYIDNCVVSGSACTSTVAGNITLTNLLLASNKKANVSITSSGAITASTLTANYSSTDNGGFFDNHFAKSAQNISISSADFGSSQLNGLVVTTKGSVTLNYIQASGNHTQDGIDVDATAGTGTVTLLNTLGPSNANSNPRYGLYVLAKGAISLNDISTNDDAAIGIYLDNTSGTGSATLNNAGVSYNDATVTTDYAITIASKGAISVLNPYSDYNYGSGIWLDNHLASSAQPVTVTACEIYDNSGDGLVITSKGNVTLSGNSEIYWNNKITTVNGGLYIDNTAGTGTVTISNLEVNNNHKGINITSNGNILLNTVTASYNVNEGAILTNTGSSTATITVNAGSFTDNGSWGLDATSKGTITLTSIYSDGNNITTNPYGVNLDNSGGTGGVVLNGTTNTWNYIGYSNNGGLNIATNGAVTVNYIEAEINGGRGINIVNSGTGAVTLSNVEAYSNTAAGVYVIAKGTITLSNPDVTGNQGSNGGVYLRNDGGTGGVVVQGTAANTGSISENHNVANTAGDELYITTNGSVTINYLNLSYSPVDGLYIDNLGGTAAVSLNQVGSTYNGGSGVEIFSQGAVTVSGLQTTQNGGYGLNVITNGTITLTSINATSDNAIAANAYVVNLDNSGGTGGVVLNGTTNAWNVINGNSKGGGLYISTNGAVTVNDIDTESNAGGRGLQIQDAGTGAVTITNATSWNNSDMGILVTAKGTITLTNPSIQNNNSGSAGVSLNNTSGTGGVVVQGTSGNYGDIEYNHDVANLNGNELVITSNGAVSLSDLELDGAPQDGLDIDNTGGTGTVTLNSVTSGSNKGYGIKIYSHGAITGSGLNAGNNGNKGLFIQNNGGAAANVTLTNVTTDYNAELGSLYLIQRRSDPDRDRFVLPSSRWIRIVCR